MFVYDISRLRVKRQCYRCQDSLVRSAAAAAAAADDDDGDYIITADYLLISFYTIDCVRKDVLT